MNHSYTPTFPTYWPSLLFSYLLMSKQNLKLSFVYTQAGSGKSKTLLADCVLHDLCLPLVFYRQVNRVVQVLCNFSPILKESLLLHFFFIYLFKSSGACYHVTQWSWINNALVCQIFFFFRVDFRLLASTGFFDCCFVNPLIYIEMWSAYVAWWVQMTVCCPVWQLVSKVFSWADQKLVNELTTTKNLTKN